MFSVSQWSCAEHIDDFITEWDGDAIVYNPASGETHELNLLAVDTLRILTKPHSISQLAEKIQSLYQIPASIELTSHLQNLIRQFDNLGLIEIYTQ